MKKLLKFMAIPLVGIMLASCQAKNALYTEQEFKTYFDTNVQRVQALNTANLEISYKETHNDLDTMSYNYVSYSVVTKDYTKLLSNKAGAGIELTVSKTTVTAGVISIDEEGAYVTTDGGKTTVSYAVGLYKDGADLYFMIKKDKNTIDTYSSVHEANTAATDGEVAYVASFFQHAEVAPILDELKNKYNGYLDEITASLVDANAKKEIPYSKTTIAYRYFTGAEGYHEFVISTESNSLSRVGYRTSLDSKQATTVALSGF